MLKEIIVFGTGLFAGYVIAKRKFDERVKYIEDVYSCMSCGTEEDVEIDEDTLYDEETEKTMDEEYKEYTKPYKENKEIIISANKALFLVENFEYTSQYMTFYKGDNVWVDENGADCDEMDDKYTDLARTYKQDDVVYLVDYSCNVVYEAHVEEVCFYEEDEADE